MKTKTVLIIALAVFIAIIAGLFYVYNSKTVSLKLQSAQKSEALASNYFTYSEVAFAEAKKKGKTILFFWAPWCGTCSFLDDEIKSGASELPSDLTILRVNYDMQTDLKNKYGITFQHTLVQVDKDGNEIKKWIGGGMDLIKQQIE